MLTRAEVARGLRKRLSEEELAVMDQCSILYVKPACQEETQAKVLRSLGFRVDEAEDLPANEAFAQYHAVVVRANSGCPLPMLAARLRAKPRFGRRILIALVSATLSQQDKREAVASGFDYTLPERCGARDLAATILRLLRPYPEFRCLLRSPSGRRRAA
jgi:CheY-like chemotaxis protein